MSLTVLIVDDEENFRKTICKFLEKQGYTPLQAGTLAEARQVLNSAAADVVLLDARLPDGHGPSLLEETAHMINRPPIILITGHADVPMAVEAMDAGAHYFFSKPIDLTRLGQVIARAGETVRMRRELHHLRQSQIDQFNFVIGDSPQMAEVMHKAQRAAKMSVSVLITGETGTGKEILARAIHRMGPRSGEAFVAINCAAIQSTVLESELFGYEAGAFTGADKRKAGLMEVADGGVLFLDEISSMPLEMQAKVLRALEDHTFRRMGGTQEIQVDVHVLAASNRDLKKMIAAGTFRDDLYYRLKVVDLHLPDLRERKQDIPGLVGFFLQEMNPRKGTSVEGVTPAALERLIAYDWPGNIRELKHAIEHALLYCEDAEIDIAHLPAELARPEFAA
ncbi:MAG: sigma-54-dependent Fis family transcriptional regulator [Anaerolineae bacterium]|nr:MAG: sigma-54-dependent Fis family transcriptional regulator [Anaerolineae bacterium]